MPGFVTELKKALLDSSATALNPYDLDRILHEELLKLQPLFELMDVQQAEGKTHEYSVRSTHPNGWFEGEKTPQNAQAGTYARKTVMLKIMRQWGGVTGFSKAVTEKFVDNLAVEIEGALEGLSNVIEFATLYGTSDEIGLTGDAYQYSGILPRLYAYAPGNVIDAGGDKLVLADLDAAIAKVRRYRQTRNDPAFWMMGMEMKQVADGLQSKVQLPLQTVQLADGKIEMAAYGRAPIMESDFVVPATATSSPTPTTALAAGGTLPDATAIRHRISSVTLYGEQEAGVAGTQRTTGTGNFTINLTWTADANAKLYMIWRQEGNTAPYYLIDIIAAKTYDSAGTVSGNVAAYSDTGAKAQIAVEPLEAGEELIVLANSAPRRGASYVGMVDDMGQPVNELVSYVDLARTGDSYDFFLKSYHAVKLVHPNLVSVIRHVKRV